MTTEPSIEVQKARADLASTLTAIEDKLNVPRRTKRAVRMLSTEHPVAFIVGCVGTAAAVGGAVWFGVTRVLNR